ncbi:hypothetical protein CMO92_04340 [Candidatus Woesearchaeota archaeon]|nr:hypothetical protein [Candidatus Woesearchaeota archaeon]|tara:strand:+ start:555 stop:740 length:186 start_codon:yes stop_codon:yes gene_type:complete
MAKKLLNMTIDLGNGVKLLAPIKLHMTYEEWQRMSSFINSLIHEEEQKELPLLQQLKNGKP